MKRCHLNPFSVFFFVAALSASFVPAQSGQLTGKTAENGHVWWLPELAEPLSIAGENRPQLETALQAIAPEARKSLSFLIGNMPARDLKTLSASFLIENVELAHRARKQLPWGHSIPDKVFLNDVLPYANVDEPRHAWRKKLLEICLPIVKDCKTPAEAAQKLNEELFSTINVKYSTARKRANQSPDESIEQGLASCTGLSILLTDACRSVCVPARLTGIPSWPNKRGNHTWVEVWDQDWHFTGAAEPSGQGLNHAWFQNDAALAKKDSRLNAIYAISFKKTPTAFPIVWSNDPENPIYAVNVTDRYTGKTAARKPDGSVNAMIRVWNPKKTQRIVADVELKYDAKTLTGKSRDNSADMNDMLGFAVRPNQTYNLQITFGDQQMKLPLKVGNDANQVTDITFGGSSTTNPKDDSLSKQERQALLQFFSAANAEANFPSSLQKRLESNPSATRDHVWQTYLDSPLAAASKEDFDNHRVRFQTHTSPYTIKEVGKRPKNGWPLFIAMHGGGGAPAKVNDSQWRHMQIYYKDQTEVGGYLYLALRAPNNTWNGFYDDYVYPLIENLIAQMVIHGDVDPNKVFIMGYSHGGYGAFAIGPKIPDRFAAVHASAAAPTDGQTSAKTLRNTRFTFMVGEKDTAYGRRSRCETFAEQIKQLKKRYPDDYPVEFMFKPGFGHGGLPDRDMIGQMYSAIRNPAPNHLTWEQTDSVVKQFYWISASQPERGHEIDAAISNNQITVTTNQPGEFTIWLNRDLVDASKPVTVIVDGHPRKPATYQSDIEVLCQSIRQNRDINLAYDFKIVIKPGE